MGKKEKKMADYRNHKRFTIKCLKHDIIPVSVRLKTNVQTARGLQIIRKAEKQLLNEHISVSGLVLYNCCASTLKDYLEESCKESINLLGYAGGSCYL